jgi:hypothetical protein
MAEKKNKKYIWFKMPEDFHTLPKVRKMRKSLGALGVIIYEDLMRVSLKNSGYLVFEGYEDTLEDEMAYAIDEEAEEIKKVLDFMLDNGMMAETEENKFIIYFVVEHLGTGESTPRVQAFRARQKAKQKEQKKEDAPIKSEHPVNEGDENMNNLNNSYRDKYTNFPDYNQVGMYIFNQGYQHCMDVDMVWHYLMEHKATLDNWEELLSKRYKELCDAE